MLITGTPPQITLAGDETLKVKQDNNTEEITVDHLAAYIGGGGGGATDHGALTGLADDDHVQYLNNARGDARYSQLAHTHTGIYDPTGTASAAIATHEAASDPHPNYITTTEANAAYSNAWMERRLTDNETKTNDTTVQPWFLTANSVSLEANSTYEFEGYFASTNGTTSHGLNMQFDAISRASIQWSSIGAKTVAGTQATALRRVDTNTFNTNRNVTTASTVAGNGVHVAGVIRTTTAGSFAPRVAQTAASGSFIALAGTYMRIRKVGSNTLTNTGQWV